MSNPEEPSSTATKDRIVVLSELLVHIHGYYKAALDRLPVAEMPALIPRLLDSGVCFGLMDPVSNIIANTLSYLNSAAAAAAVVQRKEEDDDDDKRSAKAARKRRRKSSSSSPAAAAAEEEEEEAIMSEIAADASCIRCLPPRMGRRETSSERRRAVPIAQRSLEGLVTFLICYFRHLPVSEALHYLLLTKADLLAAVLLIEHTRGGTGSRLFPISSSPTTVAIALRCAAMSASHPDPPTFAARSLSLPSQILTIGGCCLSSPDAIKRLHELLHEHPLMKPPDNSNSPNLHRLTILRLNSYIKGSSSLDKFPLEFTETLRTLLLEKIHVFYLNAIARLPRDDLRERYHQGLLKAGHCFGPANDPVSNIILNTIWYETAFPPHEELELDMICTNSLVRIECRSLNGLLAFLRNLFPALSEHDAMIYLFRSGVSLEEVIFRAMLDHDISSSFEDAYKAAAEAAWHPHPDAQAEFAVSTNPMLLPLDKPSLAVSHTLTSSEVELISRYFSQKSYPAKSVPSVPELVPRADELVKRSQQNFMANQYFIRRKVKAALKRYATEKVVSSCTCLPIFFCFYYSRY
uniref:PIR2-like helical domain-containing protein n=1 Tax=Oryza meridionalis TaxID=40149 RepID=A0A0E0E0Y9_9ORYZ